MSRVCRVIFTKITLKSTYLAGPIYATMDIATGAESQLSCQVTSANPCVKHRSLSSLSLSLAHYDNFDLLIIQIRKKTLRGMFS